MAHRDASRLVMSGMGRLSAAALLAGASTSGALAQGPAGQPPAPPPPIVSMGQPPLWQPYASVLGTFGGPDGDGGGLTFGVHRTVLGSPVVGLFGLALEGYATAAERTTGGARLLGVTRAINLGYGLDWDARAGNTVFVLSFNTAVRRGGILGGGTMLRVDWLPARDAAINVGLTVPLFQRYAGRTRPRHTGVWLEDEVYEAPYVPGTIATASDGSAGNGADSEPSPAEEAAVREVYAAARRDTLPSAADTALRRVREAAGLLTLYANFFSERHEDSPEEDEEYVRRVARAFRDSLAVTSPTYPEGRTLAAAERVYAASLGVAFGAALGDSALGADVGRRARAGLLDRALLPYNSTFGQHKNHRSDISPLLDATREDFAAWLADSSGIAPERRGRALLVHDRWLAMVERVLEWTVDHWGDSRSGWLPLQLALTPDQHDEQAEIDALLARAVDHEFTSGNELEYLHENRVALEMARTIRDARDYHVLWIHDFAATRPSGDVDLVGFRAVADVYFPALTRAVERYDSTGTLTTYLIFLDQNFYEPAGARTWMTILEDPLGARVRIPGGSDSLEAVLRERQDSLRAAVARSRGLQANAARRGGDRWLRRTVKVHVNITQPSDFAYRTHRIIGGMAFLPDNLMRDHRKIAFHDVTEAEPRRGVMVLSGVGIGEQYSSPTWEDRGLEVRGPAVLEARAAARRLLLRNGFAEDEIPPPLRETAPCAGCAAAGGEPSVVGRALQVHNEPGFGDKHASVARAMLYSLAPRGSVLVVPDGLWLGSTWAGMLVGAALRGCHVMVVAPAIANAPSAGFPQMARTQDVMLRLLQMRREFAPVIRRAGGELRVGLYATREDVNDVAAQARAMHDGLAAIPWLRGLFPFRESTLAVLDSAPAILDSAGYRPFALGRDLQPRLPQLHRKTQLVADSAALARLAARPEWAEVARYWFLMRGDETRRLTVGGPPDERLVAGLSGAVERLARGYLADKAAADSTRMTFYLTVGTQNQDPRGMSLDGEAVMVVSGLSAVIGITDMLSLLTRTTWIETSEELYQLMPRYKGWQRWVGRLSRYVL